MVLFRKTRETEQEVEYIFGDTSPDRSLTIHKADGTYQVADGREDHALLAAIRRIRGRAKAENAWPTFGAIQA